VSENAPNRELIPLREPPPGRPVGASQPCAACGLLLDPLRAPRVLVFDDGFRFLCCDECLHAFRQGHRHRRKRTPTPLSSTTPLATPAGRTPSGRQIPPAVLPPSEERAHAPWAAVALVVLSMLVGLGGDRPTLALVSAVLTTAACGLALWTSRESARVVGLLGWAVGPAGAITAAGWAWYAVSTGEGGWLGVQGAALAAGAMVARAFLDRESRKPIEHSVYRLVQNLPARVHVPVKSATDPLAMSMELADADAVRTGEEVVALRGNTLAVDGVVQAGECQVIPYPGASTPIRRTVGNPVLAGAKLVDGAVRVLATRVGDDRALVRVAHFGTRRDREPSPLSRAGELVSRWGALATLGLALGVLVVAEGGGFTAPVAAAAAVLLSAPLLSLRRVAEAPLQAAAATAGARGIVYRSGDALDTVGRVTGVAMSPYGTLTAGRPEVVEFHPLDHGDLQNLIAMAAAAERAAGSHAIARAVDGFARDQRVPVVDVRRPVHHPGQGVTAISPDGQPLVIGSRRLLLDEGISVAVADAEAARAEAAGRTPIFVAQGGRVRAVMTIEDELRVGARPAIQRMFDMGLEVVLLTGDQRGAVQRLAAALDVEHIKGELLPEERGQQVQNMREAGGVVAAVGWPGPDDAALAAADAAIVLGAAGGPAGEKAAALVSDDVRDAAAALFIARAARDASQRAAGVATAAFATIVAAAAAGLIVPGVAALFAVAVDSYCLRAGPRLLRRIALRLPART
jgi:cation transport ATPase